MAIYASDFAVLEKEDKSPLTRADTAAHEIIIQHLKRLEPALPILSEEAVEDFCGTKNFECYWLVDPLDGTKEFIKHNGEFTVNIALIKDGHAVLGVVYAPVLNVTYLAAEGVGAFREEADGRRASIHVTEHSEGAPWRVVGSRSHTGNSLASLLQKLVSHELISMGSSLKFCLIAEGSADIYPRLGPTSLWDTAAAQCVVEQAGGSVLQLSGEPITYEDPSRILNPFFVAHGASDVNWPNLVSNVVKVQFGSS
jgi:3'(2'), 5'-bisphosphate nucleotidase